MKKKDKETIQIPEIKINESQNQISSSTFDFLIKNKIALGMIFLSAILLYSNTIFHEYALDDQLAIYDNKFVTKGIEGIPDIITHDAFVGFFGERGSKLISGGRYRPLSFITFALEWNFFGRNPMIGHVVNILIYGFLCCGIYLFLVWLFPPKETSEGKYKFVLTLPFLAAIFYTFHPIHTEVVANIKGRDELLGFLFSIWSLIYFFQYFNRRAKDYVLLSLLFLFALLSKENSITFLLIFPLVGFIKREKLTSTNFTLKYACILVSTGLYLFIRYKYTESGIDAYTEEILNNPFVRAVGTEKWGTIIYSFYKYFILLIFPHPLTHDYYFNQIPYKSLSDPIVRITLLGILGISGYTFRYLKTRNELIFSILFFCITFSIVSNVFFTVGIIMNERFVFISSLGFCIIFSYILVNSKINQNLKLGVMAISLLFYSIKTYTRNFDWKDNYTLFSQDYMTSRNSSKVSTAYGGVLMEKATEFAGKDSSIQKLYTDSSIKVLEHSLRIYPENSQAWLLYGNSIYARNKNKEEAIKIYQKAIEYRPNGYFDAFFNIGILYYNDNNYDSSLVYMEKAHKSNMEHKETREMLSKLYAKSGRTMDALQLAGNDSKNLGELALNAIDGKNYQEAISLAEQALAINPNDAKANYVKGICYSRYMNKLTEGIPYLEKALSLDKTNGYWMEDLAVAYGMSGQVIKTVPLLEEVIRLRPNDPAGYRNLATTYANLGKMDKAKYYMTLAEQKSTPIK